MIEKFLLEGKRNAIKSQKLADLVGCKSVRELQEVIAEERAAGAVILSFFPLVKMEAAIFCRPGTSRRL